MVKRLKKVGGSNVEEEYNFRFEDGESAIDEEDESDEMADFIVEDENGDCSHEIFHQIFGDTDELLKLREAKRVGEDQPLTLTDKYIIERDNRICDTDVPERIQISEESTGPPPTDAVNIKNESEWIYKHLCIEKLVIFPLEMKEEIKKILQLMNTDKFEVPFIAMHQKDICGTLYKHFEDEASGEDKHTQGVKWHKALWAIKDLNKTWLLLKKRKDALQLYYKKCSEEEQKRTSDETKLRLNQQILKALSNADSEKELNFVHAKFNLHSRSQVRANLPTRLSFYSICRKAGLWEVARKIGCNSEKFGLYICGEEMRVEHFDHDKDSPEKIASKCKSSTFDSPQEVLKGARHMATMEIISEPRVRIYVLGIFMENAVISTRPTRMGTVVIDTSHQFADIKWLREKPVKLFLDAQWLQIQKAEANKLIQVTVKLSQRVLDKLVGDCGKNYLSNGDCGIANLWNEQRKLILQDALFNFLIPNGEDEIRCVLTRRAKKWLLMQYGMRLWEKVSVAPYQREGADDSAPKVLACCLGSGKPTTTFVMLDSSGEVLDVFNQKDLPEFVTRHQPHVVVIGASNLQCVKLKDDVNKVISKGGTRVVYGDETLPRIYENSRISSDHLPGQPGIVRRAVALGRYLQNPLAMVSTLCGPGREILSWNLCPLQHYLIHDSDEKYDMVEQVMVDIINQVGVDINLATSHEWLFSTLQFVSGLGPRKAASLHTALRNVNVASCAELKCWLKEKVFTNAVGFLRVRPIGLQTKSSQMMVNLDQTRMNPGFPDPRYPYKIPDPDEEFYMILGETKDTIAKGKVVQVTVQSVQHTQVTCSLECGLRGFITREEYSDFQVDLRNELKRGDILMCKIISIAKTRFQVYLSSKESVMKIDRSQRSRNRDPYYKPDDSSLLKDASKEKDRPKKHFSPRMIEHPRFKNITSDEAIEFLSDKDVGESIIRPSSRGPLSLMVKFYEGVYSEEDIFECGTNNIPRSHCLGRPLQIREKTFEDLDEVMDRYVDPLVTHLKALLSYRKFRRGLEDEVDELLRLEKSEWPNRIVYCFGICFKYPGNFVLTHISSRSLHHEYVGLRPDGFKYRGRMFQDINMLVLDFQKEILNAQPRPSMSVSNDGGYRVLDRGQSSHRSKRSRSNRRRPPHRRGAREKRNP